MATDGEHVSIWDCHFHILEPEAFPYKSSRRYTPAAAPLKELMRTTVASNFLLVQASVEDGETSVLSHLKRIKTEYPNSICRAEIEIPHDRKFTESQIRNMTALGVRCVRLRGDINNTNADPLHFIRSEFLRIVPTVSNAGWGISALCPLDAWTELIPWLMEDKKFNGIYFIAEHNAGVTGKKSVNDLKLFFELVEQYRDRLFIKLCGINRLEAPDDPPGRMKALPPVILAIAERLPDNVIWGSDWPHANHSGYTKEQVAPNKAVDLRNEINLLRAALTPEHFEKLMSSNPSRLFSE